MKISKYLALLLAFDLSMSSYAQEIDLQNLANNTPDYKTFRESIKNLTIEQRRDAVYYWMQAHPEERKRFPSPDKNAHEINLNATIDKNIANLESKISRAKNSSKKDKSASKKTESHELEIAKCELSYAKLQKSLIGKSSEVRRDALWEWLESQNGGKRLTSLTHEKIQKEVGISESKAKKIKVNSVANTPNEDAEKAFMDSLRDMTPDVRRDAVYEYLKTKEKNKKFTERKD